jgi:adenylate cyclase
MGDLKSTPVAPVYPGVEVHATIVDGILNNRIYYHPSWALRMTFWLTVGIGGIISVLWIALSVRELVLGTVFLTALLFFLNQYLWSTYHYVLSFLIPILLIWLVFLMNLGHGYWRESRKKSQLKSMFGQYVPPQHVEKMLTDPSVYDLEGESREMTVLFADIRNFTSITEKMTAAELKRILNDYLTPMTKIIFDHDGTIDKYVGDMIMAFWGAPLEDPDHATKAIRAALAMQKELKHRGEFKLKSGETIQINIGIGLNTGIMNVGDMGSSYRRAYTVLGDAVNLGSRLEASSKFYGAKILVGEKTREGQTEFLFRLADKVRVKGKIEAIQAYEPLCFMSEASPELITNITRYHEGIELYYRQQWDEAEKIMEDLSRIYPPIKIYKIYLERIRSFRQSPPGSDWDGVFIREEK